MRKHLIAALALVVPSFAIPLVNQLGFAPESEKIVVIPGNDANPFEVRDMAGNTVLALEAPMVYDWDYSGEEVQTFDISALKAPGTYRLFRGGEYVGTPIVIGRRLPSSGFISSALAWLSIRVMQASGRVRQATSTIA